MENTYNQLSQSDNSAAVKSLNSLIQETSCKIEVTYESLMVQNQEVETLLQNKEGGIGDESVQPEVCHQVL